MTDMTLGSDENSLGKEAHLLGVLIILGVFMFFTANVTQQVSSLATFYLLFSLVPIVAIIYDMLARRTGKSSLIDTITIEKESPVFGELNKYWKALIVAGSLAFGGWMLLGFQGKTSLQLVGAPTFQLIEPGPGGSAFASAAAALPENMFFWCFLMPTVFLFLRRVGWHQIFAGLASVLAIAVLFTLYHVGVYGSSAILLDQVFLFGLIGGGLTILTGSIIPVHSVHFFNNFGVTFFRFTSVDIFLWVMLYWMLIGVGTWAYLRRAE